jgi:hypothetical protein
MAMSPDLRIFLTSSLPKPVDVPEKERESGEGDAMVRRCERDELCSGRKSASHL